QTKAQHEEHQRGGLPLQAFRRCCHGPSLLELAMAPTIGSGFCISRRYPDSTGRGSRSPGWTRRVSRAFRARPTPNRPMRCLMEPVPPLPECPESLLRHDRFLRRLARDLVAQAADAEDLVQQALLRALGRPPGTVARPRAWLAATVK